MYQFTQKHPLVNTSLTLPAGAPGAMASKQRMGYLAQPSGAEMSKIPTLFMVGGADYNHLT